MLTRKMSRSNVLYGGVSVAGVLLAIMLLAGCVGTSPNEKPNDDLRNVNTVNTIISTITGEKDIVSQVKDEIIPLDGQKTSYGIPLSLENTEKFKLYYNYITLTPEQEKIKNDALSSIPAPCCPDKPMSTCCCPCSLAKSVWGMSNYLIKEKGYNTEQVRESAIEWLRFIRQDYFIKEELKNRGIELSSVGLTPEKPSCYTRRCNLPFAKGGCGGMG